MDKSLAPTSNDLRDMKDDRDQLMSANKGDAPTARFSVPLRKFSKLSGAEPVGEGLTRQDVDVMKQETAADFLKKHTMDSEVVSYFSLISDVFCELCDKLFTTLTSRANEREVLRYSLGFFQNFTDSSPNFSKEVANDDRLMKAFSKIITQCNERLVNGTLKKPYDGIVNKAMNAVYNIVRLSDSSNVVRVREFGLIEAAKPILKSDRIEVKDTVMLLLIFAASEDDAKKCCCDEPTISYLTNNLQEALASKRHRSKGYSDVELMEAIKKLAVIDDNKKILAKLGCLQMMKDVLEKSDDDEVLILAFGIMTQLAFDQDNAKWINKEVQSLLDSKFMKSSQPHLREAARSLKWVVEAGTQPQQASKGRPQSAVLKRSNVGRSPPKEKHIMISYNHASKDFVKKLIQILKNAKLGKIWVDTDDMKENWLDDMASAVENAWVVLACVSLKYKDSENCKSEALYAKRCGVPIIPLKVEKWKPDGWVGILIVSLTYYDFSKEDSTEQMAGKLTQALRDKLAGKDCVDAAPPIRSASTPQTKAQPPSGGGFCKWSTTDVQNWCKKNGIPGEKCKSLDGEQIQMLKDMYQTAQEAFFRELKDEFNFSLGEKTAFIKAMNAL